MKKLIINYGGAIMLYLVIFWGIVAINYSIKEINGGENTVKLAK